jgi:signal-transduction protein with cAMP-binding, CBS, and nucleotidyltransferase domain
MGKGCTVVSKVEFLGQLPIFSQLYPDELEALAQITDEYEFEKGAAVAYQRDVADKFYIVRGGRLVARQLDDRGMVQDRKFYLPGDYFKDIWLFTPMTHEMTVNAAAPGRMLVISKKSFCPSSLRILDCWKHWTCLRKHGMKPSAPRPLCPAGQSGD